MYLGRPRAPNLARSRGGAVARFVLDFKGSACLTYTGLCGGLEHLKIESRLIGERFENVKGEYVI